MLFIFIFIFIFIDQKTYCESNCTILPPPPFPFIQTLTPVFLISLAYFILLDSFSISSMLIITFYFYITFILFINYINYVQVYSICPFNPVFFDNFSSGFHLSFVNDSFYVVCCRCTCRQVSTNRFPSTRSTSTMFISASGILQVN